MTAETYTEWLTRIVAEDNPANGGLGLLTIGDCQKCDGFGVVETVGTWADPTPRLRSCPQCGGTRYAKGVTA
jgi:hypothetical protein